MTRSYAPEYRGARPGPWFGAVCAGRPALLMAGAAVLLAMAAVVACRAAPQPEQVAPPPVIEYAARPLVLITIDTLRADHLGSYGYGRDTSPTLDAFAAESVLFERAYSSSGTTLPSHVALFTGLYPLQTGVVMNGSFLESSGGRPVLLFAEMLKGLGYQTAGYVSAQPVNARSGIGAGMDFYDGPAKSVPQRPANETTDNALRWLAEQAEAPFFLWVHYFDPHTPYEPPSPYDERFSDTAQIRAFLADRGLYENEIPGLVRINDMYDGEIAFTDSEVARLLGALRERGWYDDATVVITADHGEGLYQHERLTHGRVYDEVLRVPLMIKFPAGFPLNGTRIDELVSLIDVVPTLAVTLSLPLEQAAVDQFEGRNVFDAGTRREHEFAQRTFRESARVWGPGQKFVLFDRAWKYHLSTEIGDELYDLAADPHELRNVIVQNPRTTDRMRQLLEDLTQRYSSDTRRFAVRADRAEETLEALRALGYIQ